MPRSSQWPSTVTCTFGLAIILLAFLTTRQLFPDDRFLAPASEIAEPFLLVARDDAVLDRIVDEYEPVVAGIENDIDEIEDSLFAGESNVSQRIYELARKHCGQQPTWRVSLDVLLFYVFFEAMLIPMYFMIGRYGGARR